MVLYKSVFNSFTAGYLPTSAEILYTVFTFGKTEIKLQPPLR